MTTSTNTHAESVESFGREWERFDQQKLSNTEAQKIFAEYFSLFPWSTLPANAIGFDMGCGSGRWAKYVAKKVGHLHCIDPSNAIDVARSNLQGHSNVSFHQSAVADQPLDPESQDFGYSLGVLHHVPDTGAAIQSCAKLLKPGAPFLLYLYYAFDNKPGWYRMLWRISDIVRRIISRFPAKIKHTTTDIIAALIYWPLAKTALMLEKIGISVESMPLAYYRNHSFYTMRTDALDRFGTPLEQRFTKKQVMIMMDRAGFVDVRFSDSIPFWTVVGIKSLS